MQRKIFFAKSTIEMAEDSRIMVREDGAVVYYDCTLSSSDIALLNPPNWLNDNCILFWFEHLLHQKFPSHAHSFLLLHPAAAFTLQFLPAQELLADTPDNLFKSLPHKQLVLIPIVGQANLDLGGGMHWSLLVLHDQVFYHVDSTAGMNSAEARATMEKVQAVLERSGKGRARMAQDVHAPQQQNSFDCGVFVVANAEFVLDNFLRSGQLCIPSSDAHVVHKRKEMLDVISSIGKFNDS